ncbi:hypothetical protein SERN_0025 [Serinibacter arcticus]|uniref:HNH nuclease domain-containing protein n=1 Tax=Serinibacter arcticus TaxID=1655435 RepID=A0A4Z1E5X0_9MICO|nr:hypothetical protein SERN_0025 [Serinibacter arcticus]
MAAIRRAVIATSEAEAGLVTLLDGASWATAADAAEEVERLARVVHRLQLRVAGAVEASSPARSGVEGDDGPAPYRRGCDLLRTRVRIGGAEARRRIRTAAALLPGTSLTGEPLEARSPVLAVAVGLGVGLGPDGVVRVDDVDARTGGGVGGATDDDRTPGAEAIAVILRVLDRAAAIAPPDVAEHTMTTDAATFDPGTLERVGQRLLAHLDPDGDEPREKDLRSRQGVHVGATRGGLAHLDIWADLLQAEVLLGVFDAGTNPRAAGGAGPGTEAGPTDRERESEPPLEDRTRPQIMLDALISACQTALRAGELPRVGGLPPRLMVTMGLEDLRAQLAPPVAEDRRDDGPTSTAARTGLALLPHAGPVPAARVRRLACDADMIPVVLGGRSEIVDLGRRHRLVPASLRRALVARDGGCIFPGCTIPSTWCEAHHVVPWMSGGRTDADNCVLLCSGHHHAVHTGRWLIVPTRGDPARTRASGTLPAGSLPRAPAAIAPLVGTSFGSMPFEVTSPWSHRPAQRWNAYPLGA